jgi:hypothetical protein
MVLCFAFHEPLQKLSRNYFELTPLPRKLGTLAGGAGAATDFDLELELELELESFIARYQYKYEA